MLSSDHPDKKATLVVELLKHVADWYVATGKLKSFYRTRPVGPRELNKLFQTHPGLLNRFNGKTDNPGVAVEAAVITVKVLVENDETQYDDSRPKNDPDSVKTAKHFGADV